MVEKKEDATMTCQNCGTDLVCHMSSYKGDFKNKLQWQNSDSTAHYKYNGHEYSCVIPDEINLQSNESIDDESHLNEFLTEKQEQIKLEQTAQQKQITEKTESQFTKEQLEKIDQELDKLIVIEAIVTKKLSTGDLAPNPQKVGMFVKIICDKMENQN